MKLTVLLLIVFLSQCSCSQNKSASMDSIKEYSCLLVLTKRTKTIGTYDVIGIGTGFFVRNDSKLFLVSANHTFTGNDPFRIVRVDSTSPDVMAFYYDENGKKSKSFKTIHLDSIKKYNPPKSIHKSPDLLIYEIDLPQNAKINSIESHIYKDITLYKNDSLFFWGFPAQQEDPEAAMKYYFQNPYPVNSPGNFIKAIDSLNYMASPTSKQGASGSPVFVKRWVNGMDRFLFIGVVSAADDINNISYIVTYKELIKMINQNH